MLGVPSIRGGLRAQREKELDFTRTETALEGWRETGKREWGNPLLRMRGEDDRSCVSLGGLCMKRKRGRTG